MIKNKTNRRHEPVLHTRTVQWRGSRWA